MSSSSRRKFSAQFKAEAVQLVLQSQKPIAEVAGELGINAGTLGNWVNRHRKENSEPVKKLTPADYDRLAELEEKKGLLRVQLTRLVMPPGWRRGPLCSRIRSV